jgi:hypothetical protein
VPQHYAEANYTMIIELLLARGIEINWRDEVPAALKTSLHTMVHMAYLHTVWVLLEHGADVTTPWVKWEGVFWIIRSVNQINVELITGA